MKWRKPGDFPEKSGMYICEVEVIEGGHQYWPVSYIYYSNEQWPNPTIYGTPCRVLKWLDEYAGESAIQLIKDIRHGNVYNNIPSVCEKWLIENGIEKL